MNPLRLDTTSIAPPAVSDWPILQHAIDWLTGQNVLGETAITNMLHQADVDADQAAGELVDSIAAKFNDALKVALVEGHGPNEWRQTASGIADLGKTWADTTLVTYTHRAQQQGIQAVLDESPVVGELFPCWIYYATHAWNTRPTHMALDGKCAYRDSPLGRLMVARHAEINCRCTCAPATLDDVEAAGGISPGGNVGDPESMLEQYDVAPKPRRPRSIRRRFAKARAGWRRLRRRIAGFFRLGVSFTRRTGSRGWAESASGVPEGATDVRQTTQAEDAHAKEVEAAKHEYKTLLSKIHKQHNETIAEQKSKHREIIAKTKKAYREAHAAKKAKQPSNELFSNAYELHHELGKHKEAVAKAIKESRDRHDWSWKQLAEHTDKKLADIAKRHGKPYESKRIDSVSRLLS